MTDISIHIRKATPADLADVQSCARAAYSMYINRMEQETAPMFADQIAQERVHVVLYQEQFAGYVVFYPVDDHVHLENVAVLPTQSGKEIGR